MAAGEQCHHGTQYKWKLYNWITRESPAETTGQINYDARACYDRILPNLAAMANRAHGLPDSIVKLHLQITTKHGVRDSDRRR
jgi:hypothetical protein